MTEQSLVANYPLPIFPEEAFFYTKLLTPGTVGAWFLLMLVAWRSPNATLPSNDRKLARVAGLSMSTWLKHKASIFGDGGWFETNDGWTHPRLKKEWGSALQRAMAARVGANARWRGKGKNFSHNSAQKITIKGDANSLINNILDDTSASRAHSKCNAYNTKGVNEGLSEGKWQGLPDAAFYKEMGMTEEDAAKAEADVKRESKKGRRQQSEGISPAQRCWC